MPNSQPVFADGFQCRVQKHGSMGCAFVTCPSANARELVMMLAEGRSVVKGSADLFIGGQAVSLRRRTEKDLARDIFIAWGRQAEKESPIVAEELASFFDGLLIEAATLSSLSQLAPKPAVLPSCRFASRDDATSCSSMSSQTSLHSHFESSIFL
eukprot:TRINITY_DN30139_c0_g1_i1.p1 TRINITY_DN30139_c0_g1~~TRINITY_DN30139_c0_g1_i1.p1  ORF type:complete len:155 (+),score=24.38 TRINITY_DN30139_c0_g1_i1:73-537(+)